MKNYKFENNFKLKNKPCKIGKNNNYKLKKIIL